MSRKVFTAGEVLAAADVNSFLMDQTVMSFAGTAARGSAIPSPVEGMYTHLEDTDRLQFWNGSAWSSPLGLTPIIREPIGSGVTSVAVANVFSSAFDNYKILISTAGSNVDDLRLQMNNSTGSTYLSQGIFMNGSTSTVVGFTRSTTTALIGNTTNSSISVSTEVFNPFVAVPTQYSSSSMGNGYFTLSGARDSSNTSNTGFTITPATGTLTGGTITVLGYKKD
jgi:hypothetical protein